MMKHIVFLLILSLSGLIVHAQLTSHLAYRRYTIQEGLPQMQTERLWQDSQGYIYIGTLSGFVRYDGQTFQPFLRGQRENIVGFVEMRRGVSALGFRRQWLISGDEVTVQPLSAQGEWLLNNFNSGDLPNGYVLLEDGQEQNRRLCRMTEKGIKGVARGKALDAMTPDRRLYLDSLTGLHIPTGRIYAYHRQGETLYAFGNNGVYEVKGHQLQRRAAADWSAATFGLIVRSLQSGAMVVADEHSLYVFDGKSVRKMAGGFNLIKDILIDRWNRLWVATYQGVYCFFGQYFTNYRLTDDDDIVRAIGIGGSGEKVMGSLNGKVLVDGQPIYDDPQQFFAPQAATVDGKVYMAGHGDIAEIDGRRLRWAGLPNDRYQFVTKAGERLIVGSRRQILSYDPKTGQTDTVSTVIPHPWCAAEDGQGRLWIGSSFGLYTEGGKVDNLQKLVITAMAPTPWGDVVFAANDSLFLIHQGVISNLNGQMADLSGHEIRSLHVSPRNYLIVAVIDGLFVARMNSNGTVSDTRFFNHLNGFTLIEPLKSAMAEEADGRVWLAGVEETTSFLPEELLSYNPNDTYISPPKRWYEHKAVWLAALLLLTAVIWLLAYTYVKHRHAKEILQLKREKKQKELQITSIRLKAIPHFHANVLAAIEYFVMNNSADEAAKYLKLYSDFTNMTLLDIDKPAQTVEEETVYVSKYLALQKLRYGDRLTFSIDVGDDVDRQAMLPTMLLHTYVENAIKHGLSPKPEGGHVSIVITNSHGDTKVTVEDNGIGRRKAKQMNRHTTRMGLRTLNEQIRLYNKTNVRPIKERVINVKDTNGKTAGTRFELTVPKGYIYE